MGFEAGCEESSEYLIILDVDVFLQNIFKQMLEVILGDKRKISLDGLLENVFVISYSTNFIQGSQLLHLTEFCGFK